MVTLLISVVILYHFFVLIVIVMPEGLDKKREGLTCWLALRRAVALTSNFVTPSTTAWPFSLPWLSLGVWPFSN